MDQKKIITSSIIIGKMAFDELVRSESVTVNGTTSSGIFLTTTSGCVVFLTTSDHYGPVNIILENTLPQNWKNNDLIPISHDQNSFTFHYANQEYVFQVESIWNTPPAPIKNLFTDEQLSRIHKAAQQLSILKNGEGLASLLIPFMENKPPQEFESEWLHSMWLRIQSLREAIKARDISQIRNVAGQLIGSGRGLTPSGDDLLSGLFFMHQRWFNESDWFDDLIYPLINEFNLKTTGVSSTLFYCATTGEADFRIQEMADALMNEETQLQNQAINLARWGNSSGADIFLGMIMAIDCFQE